MFELGKIQSIIGEEQVKQNEPLRLHTTFHIGGPADYYVLPKTVSELADIIMYCRNEQVPYFVMGNGSNLLVSDKGFRGVIISTATRDSQDAADTQDDLKIDEVRFLGQRPADGKYLVEAGAGILLSKLAAAIASNSLAGFEFASGIPGTLGGAVTMNAGAYGGEMKDVLVSALVLMSDGSKKVFQAEQLELGYRDSIIQRNGMVVLSATFAFAKGKEDEIRAQMKELNQKRRDKQPLEFGSAGSTFKRPEGYFAGKLIQDAGLRGYREGDIMVSEKHCGFVVNVGEGTCAQAMSVIRYVQKTVQEKYGVCLEMEVKRLGEE